MNLLMSIYSFLLTTNANEFTILCLLIFISYDIQGKITLKTFVPSLSVMQINVNQKKLFSNIHFWLSHLPVQRVYHMLGLK